MKTSKFKMTELGPIPEDWEVKRLGDLFELSAAGDLQSECSSRVKTDINIHPIYSNGLENAGLYGYTSKPRYRANSITITGRGTLGHAEYRTVDFDAIIRLIVMRPSEMLDGRYVAFQINYLNPFHFEITSIPQLTVPQVVQALIPVPPLPEQEKIAEALSDVDALLSAMSTLIEKKRNIKTGAMQELLGMRNAECGMRNVPRRRLAGFSGEWVEKRLGDCGTAIRGVSYEPYQAFYESGTGRTMLLRSNNIQDNVLTFNDVVYVSEECIGDEQYMRCDDILICAANGSRNLVGKSAVLKTMGQTVTFGAFMAIFRANSDIDAGFVGYLFQTESYRKQLDDILTGSAINNLNSKDILDLAFAVPPTFAEQKAIAAVLSDMDAEIAALEAKRAKYESIKQGMMQELLTGKTRMKGE